jgi:tyrosyl-tRNA synthetase
MADQELSEQQQVKDEVVVELTPEQEERYKLIRIVGEECVKESELRNLIKNKKDQIRCYDGFEPSGRMHIAQGVMKAINVNRLTKAGCRFIFLVADWFALMNNKMGGDLQKIQTVGKYMIEVWKSIGMNLENVEFVWSSQIINDKPNEYWSLVLDIARRNNLTRILRCSQIMGRSQKDELSAAQIFYPCMQCADVFFLRADICQLGVDQRKVNMLAREYCDLSEPKRKFKPIVLSHHMLMGLTGQKMSKSDPKSAIFMEDKEEDVNMKIQDAFCEDKNIKLNPLLEYIKYIVFPSHNQFETTINDGADKKVYTSYEDVEKDFADGVLLTADVKPALAKALNKILQPVRDHFEKDENAKQLLEQVKSFRVTK